MASKILVEIAAGELIDKITILEIKLERVADENKRANIVRERDGLIEVYRRSVVETPELAALTATLKEINAAIWDIEDGIRGLERTKDFGERFVEFARAVYRTNDRRAAVKREINDLLNSRLVEEKSYSSY